MSFNEHGNEQGNYTCGLVRNAVANQLLDEGLDFADTGYLPSLARFIDKKSIAGLMTKLEKKKAAKRELPKETAAEEEPPKVTAAKGKPPK
jgi:hypothetical protein